MALILTHRAEGESVKSVEYQREPLKINKDYFESNVTGFSNIEKSEVIAYIKLLWGQDAEIMIRIFTCESNLRENATNYEDAKLTGHPSWGIAQLNRPEFEGWNDYKINLNEAFKLWQRRGIQPWSCRKLI